MPILMKYTMKENKGGWYHRRQRRTSGYSLCVMQRQPRLAFEKLLHCEPAARDMVTSAHTAKYSPLSPSDVMRPLKRVVLCADIVQPHDFGLFLFSTGLPAPYFPHAKLLLLELQGWNSSASPETACIHSPQHRAQCCSSLPQSRRNATLKWDSTSMQELEGEMFQGSQIRSQTACKTNFIPQFCSSRGHRQWAWSNIVGNWWTFCQHNRSLMEAKKALFLIEVWFIML